MKFSLKLTSITIIIAFFYVVEYHYVYKEFVYAFYSYGNIHYSEISNIQYLELLLQAIVPVVFYRGSSNLASLFSFFTYLFIYIPFVNALYVVGLPSYVSFSYGMVFFMSMCFIFLSDRLYLGIGVFRNGRKKIPFVTFEIIIAILVMICVLSNINNMAFVNFLADDNDLYERRAMYHSNSMATIIYYFVCWLSHFIIPFLAVVYYKNRHYFKLIIVIMCSILMYMINMQKASLVVPILSILGYAGFRFFKKLNMSYFHVYTMLLVGIFSFFLYVNSSTPIYFSLAALFIMRTQCIEGMQFDRYMDFFEIHDNPVTHYTHIGIVNKLTGAYPYGTSSIGQMVAGDGGNSNACFWLMDGVAAEGVFGVIVVTVLFIIMKGYINSIGLRYNYIPCFFTMIFVITTIMNTSLFTSIITGGLIIAYLTYALVEIPSLDKNAKY